MKLGGPAAAGVQFSERRVFARSLAVAMVEFHRFLRLQLWRLAAALGALLSLASIVGVHTVVVMLEWTPMAACVLIAVAAVRNAVAREQRRRR